LLAGVPETSTHSGTHMKMVKSLFLGSAASLLAIGAGASRPIFR